MAKAIVQKRAYWDAQKHHCIALVLLVWAVFGNTVLNDYSLDDNLDIYENSSVLKGFAGIPEIFHRPFVMMKNLQFDYRPVAPVTFAIEYQCFGLNPHISHFINVLLYMIAVLLSYFILRNFLKDVRPLLVFIIVALFTVHPLHTEVVASLKNRQELLSYIFGMSALLGTYNYLYAEKNKILHLLVIISGIILAIFSKLSSLPFIAMILCMFFYFKSKRSSAEKIMLSALLIAIPLVFVLCTKKWLFRAMNFDENPLVYYSSFSYKAGTTFKIFLYYIKLLLYPYPMSFYYGYNTMPVAQMTTPVPIISFLFFAFLFLLSLWWIKLKNVKGILLLFFLIALSMYNNITFNYPGLLSDRAMFMPGLWFIGFLAVMLNDWINAGKSKIWLQRISMFFVLLILVVFSVYSINRNTQWKTQLSIMEADIDHLQNSSLANFYYAWSLEDDYFRNNNISSRQKASLYLRETIRISPGMPEPYYRLGRIKREMDNDLDSSVYFLTEFIKRDSSSTKGYYELGLTEFNQQKYPQAHENFERVYLQLPNDTLTLFYLVQTTYMLKGVDAASDLNKKLMALAPQTQYPYLNEGSLLKVKGDEKNAFANLEKAVQFGAANPALINDMVAYFERQGNPQKAEHYQKYLQMQ